MLVVEHYLYSPGCCGICRGINKPTIDTGLDLDHPNSPDDPNPSAMSRFYICADCGIELARMVLEHRNLNLVRAGTVEELQETVDILSSKNLELSTRIENLEDALRTIKTIPAPPEEVVAKKNFKVAAPKEEKL